ncbi:hypothetical protein NXC24_PC02066 (plasmid) [Rhizobium sp. NXC24]|nr:hypothetical protein NXC24_PC02066 [Rhizobium sp. NXC24]
MVFHSLVPPDQPALCRRFKSCFHPSCIRSTHIATPKGNPSHRRCVPQKCHFGKACGSAMLSDWTPSLRDPQSYPRPLPRTPRIEPEERKSGTELR